MNACILIRHGATGMAGRFCGHCNPPLNEAGRAQIERAACKLSVVPKIIYCSDLLRARESAAILARRFAAPVEVRSGLREMGFGHWEGLSWQEVEQRFPVESQAWIEQFPAGRIPSGEHYDDFCDRVRKEMAFLSAQAASRALVAVTHGGLIRTALQEAYSLSCAQAHRIAASYAAIVDVALLPSGAP